MRPSSFTRFATMAVALFVAACSANRLAPGSSVPNTGAARVTAGALGQKESVRPAFAGVLAPASARKHIYASDTGTNVYGYKPGLCTESGVASVTDIATDFSGNLIVPNGGTTNQVFVYNKNVAAGSAGMCGTLASPVINDGFGSPSDAAAIDAVNKLIVVANGGGNVVTCTLAPTCTQLTSPNMGTTIGGVAMSKTGDCYADAIDAISSRPALWLYTGTPTNPCTGAGIEITSANGFSERSVGGLNIDGHLNLVVISQLNSSGNTPSTVTIYSGCSTGTCTIAGGPFSLGSSFGTPPLTNPEAEFGHLNKSSTRFVTADFHYGQIDIYEYTLSPLGLNYKYSFNAPGLTNPPVEGAAYMPASFQ
jgi:hypothetical protein